MPKKPVKSTTPHPTVLQAAHPANVGNALPIATYRAEPIGAVISAAVAAAIAGFLTVWICRRA